MHFKVALSALCAATSALAAPVKRSISDFDWGNEVMRGVNIGGWLVLEPWITPSIFQQFPMSQGIVDEHTLCNSTAPGQAQSILEAHWKSWATEQDFQNIANYGFNLVRIPIGFWAFDNTGTAYIQGAEQYLDQAIGWANSTGLKVLVDLHGAPGSQNGFDNSGERMASPEWQTGNNVQQTLSILNTIQAKYGSAYYDGVVAGIELLNEPLSSELNLDDLKQFERDGYNQQREYSDSRVVVIQDGFQDPNSYNGWLSSSDNNSNNVAIDHHEYQVFTDELVAMQPWEHRQFVCNNAYVYSGADKWTFVGEWTAAMTDCAAALNGYGIGARYDGTIPGSSYVGSCASINFIDTWDQQLKDDTRGYIEAQMEAFEKDTIGWIFWNFKTEASAEWDMYRLIAAGVMPQPLTSRQFSTICT